ncbi:hypothetical protein BB559_006433 [Furculomyces boomerangus]|uniref:CHORD domain-containing protein n=2 Tax=Harpellales TaxID=61421 RepID=A0A2T9Y2Z7_9FUNG|nr:hypothetical protein BB559_006433 [Furculomyces boomerangus]PWA00753.1 hypothetical protein BB558_003182 [Smittium angustum]
MICTNSGCGKQFDQEENSPTSCQFHPGKPIFHEGYKSWSCCNKKKLTFDEFMNTPGCKLGPHSTEKQVEDSHTVEKQFKDLSTSEKQVEETSTSEKQANQKEIFGSDLVSLPAQQNPDAVIEPQHADTKPVVEENDPEDLVVPVGTVCKRQSCGEKFIDLETSRGDGSEKAKCNYHSGQPVFHEGSKGWSCCKRRVLEFDEFLKIKGCKSGKHLFGEPKLKSVKCKADFYQTQTNVILSVFAKKVNKDKTSIKINSDNIELDVIMDDGRHYADKILLFGNVDVENSSYRILSTKIEFDLKKAGHHSIQPKK